MWCEFHAAYAAGLQLLLNLNQDEYLSSNSHGAGVVIVVHPATRMPFPEDEGFFASPNTLTTIEIGQVGNSTNRKLKTCSKLSYVRKWKVIVQIPIIINVEVCAVQYHVFIGPFCHASRFQTGLAGFNPRLIPGHFDYFTVSNVHTQKL